MRYRLPLMVIITTVAAGAWFPAFSQEDPGIEQTQTPITALSETQFINGILHPASLSTQGRSDIPFVLRFALDEGWYMYWRTPGDSGQAPSFDWSASKNVKDVHIEWPAPARFQEGDMYSFGYDNVVEIPVTVELEQSSAPLSAVLNASLIICNKICVPRMLEIRADIDAGLAEPSPYANYFTQIQGRLPVKDGGRKDGFYLDAAVLGKSSIVFTAYAPDGFDGMDIFVESDDVIMTAVPDIEKDGGNPNAALLRVNAPEGTGDLTALLLGKTITATAVKGDQAVEKKFSF